MNSDFFPGIQYLVWNGSQILHKIWEIIDMTMSSRKFYTVPSLKKNNLYLSNLSIYFFCFLLYHQCNQYVNFNCCLLPVKSLQSCQTLFDPIDGSPPGSLVPGILQARTLEWVAISFSNAGEWKVKVKLLSRVRLFKTPWTTATRLLHPWDFPGKSTGVGCHCYVRTTFDNEI